MESYKIDGAYRYGLNVLLRAMLQLWFGTLQDYNANLVPRAHYGSWIVLPFFKQNSDGIMVPVPASYISNAFNFIIQERLMDAESVDMKFLAKYVGWWTYMRRWTE